jgi:hypothetical protein
VNLFGVCDDDRRSRHEFRRRECRNRSVLDVSRRDGVGRVVETFRLNNSPSSTLQLENPSVLNNDALSRITRRGELESCSSYFFRCLNHVAFLVWAIAKACFGFEAIGLEIPRGASAQTKRSALLRITPALPVAVDHVGNPLPHSSNSFLSGRHHLCQQFVRAKSRHVLVDC